ncbi:HNH endonuclease [Psychrobacter aquaticus]|uniref:HNH domain-containing protein n=1 Tax=Psychrobacter aquaticus CMS 56 TaxID=1354303 RepID=U4T4W2_9GAMM|nr:HNH endonuclease [Psychrobacter aquaticus]ERL56407.1 hypothetical protein M917_0685 [Psychrobacter aquaticus CMS 56]
MAKVTPSMAKNQIKRSLLQIVDSHPNKTQKQQIWCYFDNCCAYCDVAIDPNSRQGHLDHLLAVQDGGSNNIYNFVLACHICNGDEKRETPWREFLINKCKNLSDSIYMERVAKIETWQKHSIMSQVDAEVLARMETIIDKAKANFDQSVEQMRILRDSITTN